MKGKTYERLPHYLKPFVVEQRYDAYTAREHATWRFIMRQALGFFSQHAHEVYLKGLAATGIPVSRIPRVEEMDAVLAQFGWGAVCVSGFIPPLAFLDFQARQVLPIAADMRPLEQIAYTPSPDIVHEAAGHAPIIADASYREYLQNYANLARKAIFSSEDIRLYEAIRALSDAKANADTPAAVIAAAEAGLQQAVAGITWDSEASKVAKMNWWTAEFGLVGSLSEPKIYGAGLLSSLGESRHCLTSAVKKLPLTLACVEQSYDITQPQPQLFVAESFADLNRVLFELEETMAFRRGGLFGLELAQRAASLTTTVLDSGLEVTGVLTRIEVGADHEPRFLAWQGGVQLCFEGAELVGHGRARHSSGFSTPLGPWAAYPERQAASLSDAELAAAGLQVGEVCRLELVSGFVVEGRLLGWERRQGHLLLLTWAEARVSRDGVEYFNPSWGEFDLAIGTKVPSVYGGPGDWEAFGDYDLGQASSSPGRSSPFTPAELRLFELYKQLRQWREQPQAGHEILEALPAIAKIVQSEYPHEWLLGVEIAELAIQLGETSLHDVGWGRELFKSVLNASAYDETNARFITEGLAIASRSDSFT